MRLVDGLTVVGLAIALLLLAAALVFFAQKMTRQKRPASPERLRH